MCSICNREPTQAPNITQTTGNRHLQHASQEDKEKIDGETANAICQTDDGRLNDLKGKTIENLRRELKIQK